MKILNLKEKNYVNIPNQFYEEDFPLNLRRIDERYVLVRGKTDISLFDLK
jgi:hypothetical protein